MNPKLSQSWQRRKTADQKELASMTLGYYNRIKEIRTMTNLVPKMLCQRPESVLEQRMTRAYEAGEGWRGTEDVGGRRMWIL